MRLALLIILLFPLLIFGQTRIISGKIIGDDLDPLPGVNVFASDTNRVGRADIDGTFKFELPQGTTELVFSFLGYERTLIKIPNDCDKLEVIMLPDAHYDFMTAGKINRIRYREFKNLKNKHHQAYEKGIFTSGTPCFTYVFKKY